MSPRRPLQSERRRCPGALVTVGMIGLLAGCASADRPARNEWRTQWEQKQALVPTEDEMVDGGRSYCDQLLADLRTQLDDLKPTPDESIDPAFESWSAHLRTLAFECAPDPARIGAQLATISTLAAEIEAALDAR